MPTSSYTPQSLLNYVTYFAYTIHTYMYIHTIYTTHTYIFDICLFSFSEKKIWKLNNKFIDTYVK